MCEPGEGAHDHRAGDVADAELAARAARRDPAAWETLFERHYRSVYAYLRFRLASPQEAEDLASQVFETAYARADTFDYRGVPIQAWLLAIARNLARDAIKKRIRRGPSDDLEAADLAGMLAEADPAPGVHLRSDLARALAELTEDQREVIRLRFILDKSVAETAVLMDRSEDAVKNLQRRALAALQRALGGAHYLSGGGAS
ncbi:RNA polymerase sigma factor [Tepidiforma thermophila]|uniref:RNA polymerase sigma-70 factor (ECF subfamily) n=1 Tax=Tepidiforma thermophila (strain KCTC 52669 / CGMCC 1.13589 / G233) TaxID=2761530 RepID=A0A2A9HH84_TEPT2|nr:RNA polymerase sigma factor [Tepidiforma thermophila]PFG75374.1 RNA polymerase sigma-70 factor (ECF subfamily) [Tepidiforma thermophila]